MSIIQNLSEGVGYLKAGFFGKEKSGKTRTALDLLIGTRNLLGTKGPIVMFDTEKGSPYLARYFKEKTGEDLVGVRSRSFIDLMVVAKEAEEMGAAGFLVDSITHPSDENRDSYIKGVNEVRRAKNLSSRIREFQDIAPIRGKWASWPDWFINAPMHIVVCGRMQNEWTWEVNEETGKKELVRTGAKMRAENEFGYEPSLLVEMERVEIMDGTHKLVHRAIVIADRFPDSGLTGQQIDEPTFEFFLPHVQLLTPGAHSLVDTTVKTDHEIGEEGTSEWAKEKRDRAILCEEIQGELMRAWPGQTAKEKKAKIETIEIAFDTRSWTKVESCNSETLRAGLDVVRFAVDTEVAKVGLAKTEAAKEKK